MEKETREKYIKECTPYLKDCLDDVIIESSDEIDSFRYRSKIEINSVTISTLLLKKIINDDEYFNSCLHCFRKGNFFIMGRSGNTLVSRLSYEKSTIIDGIKFLIEKGSIPNTPDVLDKLNMLSSVELDREKKDNILTRIEINDELRKAVFEGMPDNYSLSEKIVYIYIRLCKLLTYDEEYILLRYDKEEPKRYESLEHIKDVTPKNNKVVCTTINLLFLKFMTEIGIFIDDITIKIVEEMFRKKSHFYVDFAVNDMDIFADPLRTNIDGKDLMRQKLNYYPNGILISEPGKSSYDTIDSARDRIMEQEKEKQGVSYTINELLNTYLSLTKNHIKYGLKDRITVFLDLLNQAGLRDVDSLDNIINLKYAIFSPRQLKNNISLVLVRNLETEAEDKLAKATLIISINPVNYNKFNLFTKYFEFNPGSPLKSISKEQLQSKCSEGILTYFKDKHEIPGIKATPDYEEALRSRRNT